MKKIKKWKISQKEGLKGPNFTSSHHQQHQYSTQPYDPAHVNKKEPLFFYHLPPSSLSSSFTFSDSILFSIVAAAVVVAWQHSMLQVDD